MFLISAKYFFNGVKIFSGENIRRISDDNIKACKIAVIVQNFGKFKTPLESVFVDRVFFDLFDIFFSVRFSLSSLFVFESYGFFSSVSPNRNCLLSLAFSWFSRSASLRAFRRKEKQLRFEIVFDLFDFLFKFAFLFVVAGFLITKNKVSIIFDAVFDLLQNSASNPHPEQNG